MIKEEFQRYKVVEIDD